MRPATWTRRAVLCTAAIALMVCTPLGGHAQDEDLHLEEAVKAAYLLRFVPYVYWPAESPADTPFRIGIAGAPAVVAALEELKAEETVAGRPIDVVEIEDEAVDDLDILFVGRLADDRLEDHLAAVEGQPVLTVTELDGALERGGMINFVIVRGTVRFEASEAAVQRSPLRLSADLLKLAVNARRSGRR